MTHGQGDLEALVARLHDAAVRLKAAGTTSDAPARGGPRTPAGPDAATDAVPGVVEQLEAAGAAVRSARARLAEAQERLGSP